MSMTHRLVAIVVAYGVTIAAASTGTSAAGDDEQSSRDLEKLQGRWVRTILGAEPPRKEVLLIDGDKETCSIEGADGNIIRQTTARVELETAGDVRIYTRSNITLTAGEPLATPLPKSQSFIYRVQNGQLHELSGVLYDRSGPRAEVSHVVWTQPVAKRNDEPAEPGAASPADVPDDPATNQDQELMQGRWERIVRDADGKVLSSQEKAIAGNEETLTNRDGDGNIVRQHTARFRLEKHGPIRVFHVYELTIHIGNGAGQTFPTDFSFVYRVDEKTFLDAPGVFRQRNTYLPHPALFVWVRPATGPDDAKGDAAR